jgi:hypothetical protein
MRSKRRTVVQAMAATCNGSLIGLRDNALLLIGFAAALRAPFWLQPTAALRGVGG